MKFAREQILHKFCTDFAQILNKFCTDFAQRETLTNVHPATTAAEAAPELCNFSYPTFHPPTVKCSDCICAFVIIVIVFTAQILHKFCTA